MTRFALYYFFFFVTFGVITPYFQVFLAARGFNTTDVGLLQGVFGLAGALGSVAVGHLADRLGKRRMLLWVCMLVSLAALAPMNWLSHFWLVAPLTVLFGVAYRSTIPLADALAASELDDPARQYGRVRAMGSLGFIVMLLVIWGFGLIDKNSSTSILACFAVTTAIALPFMPALPDSHKAAHHRAVSGYGDFDRSFWLLMAVIFLCQLGMASHYAFFSLFLTEAYDVASPGVIWSVGALCEVPMLFCAGFFLRRLGVVGMLTCSLLAVAIRLSLYATALPLAAIVAAQCLHAFTFGMSHTAAIDFIRRKVPRARQGLAMTIYISIVVGLAQTIGAAGGGLLVTHTGYRRMYLIYAAAPLAGLVLLWIGRKRLALSDATR